MKRIIQTIPHPSSNAYYATDKRIYTRYHQNPQINKTSFQKNKTYKIATNIEQESMNEYISNIYKEKKYRGILDPTAPNNKNIFVETDSDYHMTDRNQDGSQRTHFKKSTQLLIAKTESQFPKTYNSQNIFRKDGLITGYYIKVNQKQNLLNKNFNTISNHRQIKKALNTPSYESEERMINKYNKGAQTQIRQKKLNKNIYLNQTYNRYNTNNEYFKKEIDLDEWPSDDKNQTKILYNRNLDLLTLEKEIKTENSNETDKYINIQNQNINSNINQNQNIYQKQKMKYPPNMVYSKRNISDIKHSNTKSNISEISEDFINQYKRQQQNDYENNNYIIAGNSLQIASPKEYKFTNESEEEESDRQGELIFYNEKDYQNYMNKKIIRTDFNNNNFIENDQGGKVDLYYGIMNNKKDIGVKEKHIIIRKDIFIEIEEMIRNDIYKLDLIIKLQRFIKSYLYLRELCAMKIQAVWRGGNTRKIMDLYNDLDEFIFHLSKVQFNHFNNDFCFFIKQLFNIYKANISNGNDKENYNIENNEEEENDDENENCMEQISVEEIDQKEGMERYLYKFPEGSYFDKEKLTPENEIDLYVEGNERKKRKNSKDYERLIRDYDELYQKYNELKQKSGINNINLKNNFIYRKDKNESESTIGSNKSDIKFRKFEKISTISRDNSIPHKVFSEIRHSTVDNGKNITFSNDYDADLDINRDDDFFNQELSYDDKDNSGYLAKENKFSYFRIHSDENSKYFDNENPNEKEREIKEGDIYKINLSKNSGGSKINSSKYTRSSSRYGKSKLVGLHRYEKSSKNEFSQSPSVEKSNNYIGHHSKTFPRKYNNYNDNTDNNILIIPKHEEDFIIINTNSFLSPKDRDQDNHIKNIRSEIAKKPNIKFEDKNWNEIIEFIKNEEIEIPTQNNIEKSSQQNKNIDQNKETKEIATEITSELYLCNNEPITNEQFYLIKSIKEKSPLVLENNVAKVNIIKRKIYKKPRKLLVRKNEEINIEGILKKNEKETDNRIFNILEKEKNSQINIIKSKESSNMKNILVKEIEEKNKEIEDKNKEIEEKNKEIIMFKKELEEIKNKIIKTKIFDSKLEINNNINSLYIEGIKPKYNELLININNNNSEDVNIENKFIQRDISHEEQNKKITSLIENKIQKEKEWNNLIINRTKKLEIKSEEKISRKDYELNKNIILLNEDKIQKEKEKESNNLNNIDINITKKIELNQYNEDIKDIKDLDSLSKLNIDLDSLLKEKIKKEKQKESINLIINKVNNIELNNENKLIDKKGFEKEKEYINKEIKEEKDEFEEKNKKIKLNNILPISNEEFEINSNMKSKEFDKLDIQTLSISIEKEEKLPVIYNEEKNIQFNIKGKNKYEKDLSKNMMSNENQLFIKGNKKLTKLVLSKEKITSSENIEEQKDKIELKKKKEKDKLNINEKLLEETNIQKLRNVYKKPLKRKEIKDKNINIIQNIQNKKENDIQKLIKIQTIDNCIQFNIDRIYENKNISLTGNNKDNQINKIENNSNILETPVDKEDIIDIPQKEDTKPVDNLENKNIQKLFIQLQPEEQNNNRFTVLNIVKEKENEKDYNENNININIKEIKNISEKQKDKELILKIIKNEDININKMPKEEKEISSISSINKKNEINIEEENREISEREIKISTKKVYRKNIINKNSFKNNSIISENNLFILGSKTKTILEKESQDNISFTIEKLIKDKNEVDGFKNNNKDNDNIINIINKENEKNIIIENNLNIAKNKEEKNIKIEETPTEKLQHNKLDNFSQTVNLNIENIIEKESEKINKQEKVQNIENCIQFNIDRIYDNKNVNKKDEKETNLNEDKEELIKEKEIKEINEENNLEKNLINKIIEKRLLLLQPEGQNNNRFTIISSIKVKDKEKEIEKKPEDINKGDLTNINNEQKDNELNIKAIDDEEKDINELKKENIQFMNKNREIKKEEEYKDKPEREIKISTKKVYRKNIIHKNNTFKNNLITSENQINIYGKEKIIPILLAEPQDNIRFTIEKIIKENEEINEKDKESKNNKEKEKEDFPNKIIINNIQQKDIQDNIEKENLEIEKTNDKKDEKVNKKINEKILSQDLQQKNIAYNSEISLEKEEKEEIVEKIPQKLIKIQNIDNCIQFNIDRIYENKNISLVKDIKDNQFEENIKDIKENIIDKKIEKDNEIIQKNKNEKFINKETNSNIESKEDSNSLEKSDLEKSKTPKKKEIIINKKLAIITKPIKEMELETIKNKFLEKRFLVKFWKIWKQKTKTEEEQKEKNIIDTSNNEIIEKLQNVNPILNEENIIYNINKRQFIELEPEKQNNCTITVLKKEIEKDNDINKNILEKDNNEIENKILDKSKEKIILEIIKNEEININKKNKDENNKEEENKDKPEREIKISTKKVYRKNIIHKSIFKNNIITSENQININGKEKNIPTFEEVPQDNNRFTVEKIIKEYKEIDNLEKIKNIEKEKEDIDINNNKNSIETEKINNNEIIGKDLDKDKQNILLNKEIVSEDINSYKNIDNNQIINEKDNQKIEKIQNIDNCIQFIIDRTYENKNISLTKDNEENEIKENQIKISEDKLNQISNNDKKKEILEQNQNKEVIEESNLINQNLPKQFIQLAPEEQNNFRFTVFNELKPKEIIEKKPKNEINQKEINISIISDKPKNKFLLEIIKNEEININNEEEKKILSDREIKISTKKVYRKNIIHNKFNNNAIISENKFNINRIEKSIPILEEAPQDNIRFTVEKIIKENKENENEENKEFKNIIENQEKEIDNKNDKNIDEENKNKISNEKPSSVDLQDIKLETISKDIVEKNILINKKDTQKKDNIQNIDNCIQLNIDRSYENKNISLIQDKNIFEKKLEIGEEKENIEENNKNVNFDRSNLISTPIQKQFNEIQPEEQTNNRFTIFKSELIKDKDNKQKESNNIIEKINEIEIKNKFEKKSSLLEIIKNEEMNIYRIPKEEIFSVNKNNAISLQGQNNVPSNKEIKITTKKIFKKSIKINKSKNNKIISENQININGKEKINSIKEVTPQENIRFTIEKILKENKEENDLLNIKIEENELNEDIKNKLYQKKDINKEKENENEKEILKEEITSDELQQQNLKNIEKEKKIKEKVQNIDNCIQLNIDRIYENKNISLIEKENNNTEDGIKEKDNKIKIEKKDLILEKINNEEININRTPKEIISLVTKNDEFSIVNSKTEEKDETSNIMPKEIKITTKKVIKKGNVIEYRFKDTLITSENKLDIIGQAKIKPTLEEESQENNRFSVGKLFEEEEEKTNKEKEKENDNISKDLLEKKEIDNNNIINDNEKDKDEIKEKEEINNKDNIDIKDNKDNEDINNEKIKE